jgi:putative ABC transport system permease protein
MNKNCIVMIRNYFLIAIRNIFRNKFFSLIIVVGLTLGIAIFGLVFTYVHNELSFDRFNEHYKSIYRLESPDWALTGTGFGPDIAQQFPEVSYTTRISTMDSKEVTIKIEEQLMPLKGLIFADSSILDIFTFHFIKGNPKHSLDGPHSLILSKSTARMLFGNEDPMNKTITINNKIAYTVTGIFEDISRFHLKVNAIAPFISLKESSNNPNFLQQYDEWNYYTFLRLKEHVDAKALGHKLEAYFGPKCSQIWGDHQQIGFFLRPLEEIYYTPVKNDFPITKASKPMLGIYMLVAIFILIIACVNFVNLTIAKASARSREIGVRKVVGANRNRLIAQFLGESVIFALIATEFSLVLMEILRPAFNNLVQRQLTLMSLGWGWIIFLILLLPLLIGILAGIYPALYLTRLNVIANLKSEKTRGKGSLAFKRVLIVLQFAISIALIIATFTVFKQLTLFRNTDLGYNKENTVVLRMNASLHDHFQAFRDVLLTNRDIKSISLCTQSMENVSWQNSIEIGSINTTYTYLGIDTGFISSMNLKMIEGRNFRAGNSSDSAKVIINEAAVGFFGLKSPVEGQFIGTGESRMEILGVVKDFHYNSLRTPIAPLVMSLRQDWLSAINIKISGDDVPGTMKYIESTWNRFCPDFLFHSDFLDQKYDNLYNDEMRLGKAFIYLALIAIFIACIGLLGLSSFMAEQRMKEIGVRKVLGDSTSGIIGLFAAEFCKWILVSGLIAIPVAGVFMHKWLCTFDSHVVVDGGIMAMSCMIALVVALLTIYVQIHRVASRNPVEALRYE